MKNKSFSEFWHNLHKKARANGFPLRVMFELTYRCNFKCGHCYVPYRYRKFDELKTKDVFCILDQLSDIGCFYLGFTGGEPFVRKDIFEILWYAKRKGFEIIIYTNGYLIGEKEMAELAAIRPNKVDITIPAITKTAFRRITRVSDARDRVFKAIQSLNKKRVPLGFKTCVLKENAGEIRNIQIFADSLNALHRLDDMLSPRLDGSKAPYRYRANTKMHNLDMHRNLAQKSCADFKNPILSNIHQTGSRNHNFNNLFKCGVGVSQAAITPLGELKMCVMSNYPKYDILGASLQDAWQRLKNAVLRINLDEGYKCHKCELKAYCKWCPVKGWLYNKSFTSCDPESYSKAKMAASLARAVSRDNILY